MKKVFITAIVLLILLFAAVIGSESWLEKNLVVIINENPDRSYDFTYESLDLTIFMGSFIMDSVDIRPRTQEGTLINGDVEKVLVEGLNLIDLAFSKKINVSEIVFIRPRFEVLLAPPDSRKMKPARKVQQLFGDILSRGKLQSFSLVEGSFRLIDKMDTTNEVASIKSLTINANGLETDSLQWKYPIPFKLGQFSSSIKDLRWNLDDHSIFSCGSIAFNPDHNILQLKDLSLKFNKDWLEVSDALGKQVDLFEMDLGTLEISGIGAKSRFFGELDIRSEAMVLENLVLKDHRDKNKSRPPDKEMPMFASMVNSIPVGLRVDTIFLRNANLSYTELPEGKIIPGTISFNNLYGTIYNLTTLESFQIAYKQLEVDLVSKLNNEGKLNVRLTVPYGGRGFHLKAQMDSLDATVLSPTLIPMADVDVNSGFISHMELDMKASPSLAQNQMILNYTDLKLNVLKEAGDHLKKRGLISDIANIAIHTKNQPGTKKYVIANYNTERNIYRGPFNFMWKTAKEGFIQIIPTKTTKGLIKK
jgi:hypothetical protein